MLIFSFSSLTKCAHVLLYGIPQHNQIVSFIYAHTPHITSLHNLSSQFTLGILSRNQYFWRISLYYMMFFNVDFVVQFQVLHLPVKCHYDIGITARWLQAKHLLAARVAQNKKKSHHSNKAYDGCQIMLLYSSMWWHDNELVWTKSISWVIDELFTGATRLSSGISMVTAAYIAVWKNSNVKVTSMVLSQLYSCPVASSQQNLGKNIIFIQQSAIMMLPWYSKVQKNCLHILWGTLYIWSR